MATRYTGQHRRVDCTALDHRPHLVSLLVDMVLDVVEEWVVAKVNSNGFVLMAEAHGWVQFAVFTDILEYTTWSGSL